MAKLNAISALAAYCERRDASVRCLDENAFDDDAPCREDKKLFYYQPHIGQFYKPFLYTRMAILQTFSFNQNLPMLLSLKLIVFFQTFRKRHVMTCFTKLLENLVKQNFV